MTELGPATVPCRERLLRQECVKTADACTSCHTRWLAFGVEPGPGRLKCGQRVPRLGPNSLARRQSKALVCSGLFCKVLRACWVAAEQQSQSDSSRSTASGIAGCGSVRWLLHLVFVACCGIRSCHVYSRLGQATNSARQLLGRCLLGCSGYAAPA